MGRNRRVCRKGFGKVDSRVGAGRGRGRQKNRNEVGDERRKDDVKGGREPGCWGSPWVNEIL